MRRLLIYLDTSVVGGCLEPQFAEASLAVFERARRGEITLVLSDALSVELVRAPAEAKAIVDALPKDCYLEALSSAETQRLRDLYLAAGVVGPATAADAHHVAIATVYRADVIVSWNFKHLVHLDKMRGFNVVNMRENYGTIDIRSPEEVR